MELPFWMFPCLETDRDTVSQLVAVITLHKDEAFCVYPISTPVVVDSSCRQPPQGEGGLNMRPQAPCKNCPNHEPGCHGRCDKYKQFTEDHQAFLKEMAKYNGTRFYFESMARKRKNN